jgi:hypothetical protein
MRPFAIGALFGGRVDIFSFRRLSFRAAWLFVVLFVAGFASEGVVATTCSTYDQAMTLCQADIKNHISGSCSWSNNLVTEHYCDQFGCSSQGWVTSCPAGWTPPPPPPSTCSNLNAGQGRTYQQGKVLAGFSFPQNYTDPTTGATIQCAMTWTPSGPPTLNNQGQWETPGQFAASGNLANGTGWKDSSGASVSPQPPTPTMPAPSVPSPPKICGGGSCYDPGSDNYCATSGGAQFCVSGATARTPAGGCVSSGDATVCAGSPTAPLPPAPPGSSISNPLTQIRSQDNTTQANSVTGTVQTISTVTYGLSSSNVASGQKSSDNGPAPASTSSAPVTASGGGDCNTPPIVNNSPGLAEVALQTWKTRCAIEANNSTGGVVGGLGTLYTPSTDTVSSVVADFQAGLATTPIGSSVTGFFSVGSVGGACPVWTVPANDYLPAQTFDFYCNPALSDLLDLAKYVLLIGCAYAAWRIAMGDA